MIKNKIINYTIFAFSFFVWSNLHILHQPDSGQNCIFRGTKSSKVEKKRGAQGSIAEYYGVNRSTVNRYFKSCIERGILTESLEFTAAGEEWLERYTKLYENLEKYLEEIGAKPEEIEESLDFRVENIDIHMLELMINAYTEKKSVYKKKENELDQEIQHNLQKCERHPVVFRLYRMNKKPGQDRG